MPYWEYQGQFNISPAIAGYEAGQNFDFAMTFVNDTADRLGNCYAFVPVEFLGMLQIRLLSEADSEFRPVGSFMDGSGAIGTVIAGDSVSVVFRLCNDSDIDLKLMRIPIDVGHDDGVSIGLSFLWNYQDLADFIYQGDESGEWISPDGPNQHVDDWRFWSTDYENGAFWRDTLSVDRQPVTYDSGLNSFLALDGPELFADNVPVWKDI